MYKQQISPSSYRWTQEKLKALKNLLITSVEQNHCTTTTISQQQPNWDMIAQKLNEKFGTAFSAQNCQDATTRFMYVEYLSGDMWALIFSFLNVNDVFRSVERVCKNWRHVLLSPDGDCSVYLVLANEIATMCGFSNAKSTITAMPHEKSYRELVKEFYITPLEGQLYESEAYTSYSNKGGVIDIWSWKPCELLKILLEHFKSVHEPLNENMKMIHKYTLMSSISRWIEEKYLLVGADDKHRIIAFRSNLQSPSPKISNVSHGILLREMMQNLGEIDLERKSSLPSLPVVYLSTLSTEDIFDRAGCPPYRMKDASNEISQLRTELFGDSCFVYEWKTTTADDNDNTWSTYWLSGMEWWGTYAFTVYNPEKNLFFVTTASTSD
ncbi:hypothetical protein C9374_007877 [Naegleria lovaniensis]|uniref:F-box domain-containing protein n=1 Tax=Naegleria lovaniensis TaxID=51637 RepID=A0AA88GG24_NAELO|nr:uncharacterized protein C9374_007877 [Naegleria lovaniensis]KAG2378729.1 hypothetical protein C9374_007877 [Naegleria lovaniensis]